MNAPAEIIKALAHVREHHPDVVQVTFDREDDLCGGFWTYATADGRTAVFGPEIDVHLLEQALDAAWEDHPFPAVYSLWS